MRRVASMPSARHPHVHEHDVGARRRDEAHGIRPVLRLTDDVEVRLGLQDHPQAAAHEGLVVGDEDREPSDVVHDGAAVGSTATSSNPPSARGPARSDPP